MKVLLTGSEGFLGRNLRQHLAERDGIEVRTYVRGQDFGELVELVSGADTVFHLAGANRPRDVAEFTTGNVGPMQALCAALQRVASRSRQRPCVVMASSIQAELDNPYGRSKREAERVLITAQDAGACLARICRLPNVFGKWARPNYNTVVATFCHYVARDLPIHIHDAEAPLTLVYVDDVVARFLAMMDGDPGTETYFGVAPQYATTVGAVAALVREFRRGRDSLLIERVGDGLTRALYATYVSYLPVERFCYEIPKYQDPRGEFAEVLKTRDSGQFSYFTAGPGVTRGGHYHHTKTEKFLVVRGQARFRFRHVQTGERHELRTSGAAPVVVETIPGWAHDITNVGSDELVVMLWANETFDRDRPDTVAAPLEQTP
jgi:UDP-2-acetamido-2,6-beta-L-arabino-hexul-4-ose reductase